MRSGRRGIPTLKIEMPARRVRRVVTPGVEALLPRRSPVRRPVEPGLGGQAPTPPRGVRAGFGLAHVDGPPQGKRNRLEHPAPVPLVVPGPREPAITRAEVCPDPECRAIH